MQAQARYVELDLSLKRHHGQLRLAHQNQKFVLDHDQINTWDAVFDKTTVISLDHSTCSTRTMCSWTCRPAGFFFCTARNLQTTSGGKAFFDDCLMHTAARPRTSSVPLVCVRTNDGCHLGSLCKYSTVSIVRFLPSLSMSILKLSLIHI